MRDAIDWGILCHLQREGRITNRALARRVGLSQSACSERVSRLRKRGVIAGYRAVIDWSALGAGFDAWVEITLDRQPDGVGPAFGAFLRASACIVSAHRLAQANAYLVHVVGVSACAWRDFLAAAEAKGFALSVSRLSVVMECVKTPGTPAIPQIRSVARPK